MLGKARLMLWCGSAALWVGVPAMPQAPTQGEGHMKNLILGIEDSAMEAWRQGNPMKWAEISADDVLYIDPGLAAPIVGRTAYAKYLEALKGKVFYDASEYVRPQVAVYGDLAVLTYNYHSLKKDPAGQSQRTSFWNTTEVYRHTGSGWKIVHTHWSYIGHSLPENLEMTIPVLEKEAKPLSGAAADIMRLETSALETWRKGDPSGGLDISADEITYFDSDTPTRLNGLAELKEAYGKVAGNIRYDVMEFIRPRFWTGNEAMALFYQFFATTLHPDGTVKARTPWNCTKVYAKKEGRWKIVHSHWSLIKGQRAGGGV